MQYYQHFIKTSLFLEYYLNISILIYDISYQYHQIFWLYLTNNMININNLNAVIGTIIYSDFIFTFYLSAMFG